MKNLSRKINTFWKRIIFQVTEFLFQNTRKKITWAIENKNEQLLSKLISEEFDLTFPIENKGNTLLLAAEMGSLPIVI